MLLPHSGIFLTFDAFTPNIVEAAEHCDVECPTKRLCVEYFTSSIKCNHANLGCETNL